MLVAEGVGDGDCVGVVVEVQVCEVDWVAVCDCDLVCVGVTEGV